MGSNPHTTVSITNLLSGYSKSTLTVNNICFHKRVGEEAKYI
jgi:hypothetical protein